MESQQTFEEYNDFQTETGELILKDTLENKQEIKFIDKFISDVFENVP